MITDPKSLIDTGLNAAVCCAFAIPGAGPVIAGVLAGGQALFDAFFQVPDRTDPGSLLVTQNNLQQAVLDMKTAVADANWQNDFNNHFNVLDQLNDDLSDAWTNAADAKGPAYVGAFASPILEKDWLDDMASFKGPITTKPSPILLVKSFVESYPSHKYKTIGLYVFTAGVYIQYCKLNVMWEIAQILRQRNIAQLANDAEAQQFSKQHIKWKFSDPKTRGPEPKLPAKLVPMLPDADIKAQSPYVRHLKDELPKFRTHLQGLKDEIDGYFTTAQTEITTRKNNVSVQSVSAEGRTYYYYHDATTKTDSPMTIARGLADAQMKVYLGAIEAAIWNREITSRGLQDITQADLNKVQTILDSWKAAETDAVAFLSS